MMSNSLNKSQETVNTKAQGGRGMMDYLKTVVALFLAVSITASAVQVPSYEITEEQDDGTTTVVKSFDGVDTTTYDTLDEYETMLSKHIKVGVSDSELGVADNAGVGENTARYETIVNEIISRGIATREEVFNHLLSICNAATNFTAPHTDHPEYMANFPDTVAHLEKLDPSQVTETKSTSGIKVLTLTAKACLEEAESRQAFDNLWAVVDSNFDQSSAQYRIYRALNYDLVLGNQQDAYNKLLDLAQNGEQLPRVLITAAQGKVDRTDALLEAIVTNGSDDFIIRNQNKLLTYWKNLGWTEMVMNMSQSELQNLVYKYKVSVPREATAFASAIANKYASVKE